MIYLLFNSTNLLFLRKYVKIHLKSGRSDHIMPKMLTSERTTNDAVELNSCGVQLLSNSVYTTVRKRIDYSLMYVAAGNAVMRVKGKKIAVSEGEAMLYPPNVPQDFSYLSGGGVNKWIHFSGNLAAPLNDKTGRKIVIKKRKEFESALNKLIDAYNCVSTQKHLLETGYLTGRMGFTVCGQ